MKMCGNCGASNFDTAPVCSVCGKTLGSITKTIPVPGKTSSGSAGATKFARAITEIAPDLSGKRRADILFVLDCTGSMQGEINAIRDSIMEFADTIKSDGVRARVGLIEFRDRLNNEEARVLSFDGQPFTRNPTLFRSEVSKIIATGGADAPESSLDAVMLALRQPFNPDASKVIVLITAAPPHIPDMETKSVEDVAQAIQAMGIDQFYVVMHTQDSASQVYLQLLKTAHNLVFDLGHGDDFRTRSAHFKKTLMSLGKTISDSTM